MFIVNRIRSKLNTFYLGSIVYPGRLAFHYNYNIYIRRYWKTAVKGVIIHNQEKKCPDLKISGGGVLGGPGDDCIFINMGFLRYVISYKGVPAGVSRTIKDAMCFLHHNHLH